VSLWPFAASRDTISTALVLSEALLLGPVGAPRLAPNEPPYGHRFGVFGAAIFTNETSSRLVAGLLVDSDLIGVPATRVPLLEVPTVLAALVSLFGSDLLWLNDAFAYSVTPPSLHVGPGTMLSAASLGTVGAPVTWGASRGVLTAGHVAGPVGSAAYMAGVRIGDVVFSRDPTGLGHQPDADVAVVELAAGIAPISGSITAAASISDAPSVEVLQQHGRQYTTVIGKAAWLYVPGYNATYADAYLTLAEVTQPGDSGAPMLAAGTTHVVGHVIGSSPGVTSYVQDIALQLAAIRGDPSFASIAI